VIASRRSKLFSGTTAAIFILHRGTLHRTVGTKDAAVARLWAQHSLAVRAFVEKLAGVGRHRFSFSEAAKGAHQHGFKKNFAHTRFTSEQTNDSPRPQSLGLTQRDSLYQDQEGKPKEQQCQSDKNRSVWFERSEGADPRTANSKCQQHKWADAANRCSNGRKYSGN